LTQKRGNGSRSGDSSFTGGQGRRVNRSRYRRGTSRRQRSASLQGDTRNMTGEFGHLRSFGDLIFNYRLENLPFVSVLWLLLCKFVFGHSYADTWTGRIHDAMPVVIFVIEKGPNAYTYDSHDRYCYSPRYQTLHRMAS